MKLVIAVVLVAGGALAWNPGLRREAGEWTRDLSDRLIVLLLRSTSGFAAGVSATVLEEERERRLRWQRP